MIKNDNVIGKGFEKHPERINRKGRPTGSKNRATIVREILELVIKFPESEINKLSEFLPKIKKRLTIEEAITIIQIDRAIRKGDTAAYKALMDSAYGAPTQQVDLIEDRLTEIKIFEIKKP